MIDYSSWPRRKFKVVSLKLDDQNPRLPANNNGKRPTQPHIIDYLAIREGAYDLAKDIATLGYFVNEEPIVCKEGTKYVVLEGNRRVAACKILINPDLLESRIKQKNIKEVLEDFDIDLIKKIEVRIAPNREAADVLIVNRHTEGASIEKWDKVKQDRFFYNRFINGESIDNLSVKFGFSKGKITDILKRYNMFQEIFKLKLNEDELDVVEDESRFSMSTMERFYKSKHGKNFLGVKFDDSGKIIHTISKEEYNKRLEKIVSDVIKEKLNTRIIGDDELQLKYVKKLYDQEGFEENIKHDEKHQEEYLEQNISEETKPVTPQTNKTSHTKKSTSKNKLIPNNIKWETGNTRIDGIFGELKRANLSTQFNSAAILFRSYLDMLIYQYLEKNKAVKDLISQEQQKLDFNNANQIEDIKKYLRNFGIKESTIDEKELGKLIKLKRKAISPDWVPSLMMMLSYLVKNEALIPNTKLRQALSKYLNGSDGYISHSDLNLLVHNEYYIKNGEDLKKIWEQMSPLLEDINIKLSEEI